MHTICEMMQEALDRLIEDREFYEARMKQYKHMAKLWKRCAKAKSRLLATNGK